MENIHCLYIITNKTTNKKYLGITLDFEERKKRHLFDLRGNRHHSIYLQRSFNKHGEESFEFKILFENLSKSKAEWVEEFYLNEHYDNIYNVSKKSRGGDLISYHPELDRIKKERSERGSAWWSSLTEEEKLSHAEKSRGENNGMYGRKHSEETKRKISMNSMGRKASEESRKKMSDSQKKRFEDDPSVSRHLSKINKERYSNPEERIKTAEATKRAFDENPSFGKRIALKNRERYKRDYTVTLPDGEQIKFTNLIDIDKFLSEKFSLGKWIIRKLIETREPWNPTYSHHKHLKGLTIIKKEL